jgi:mRNA interferase RelE/StbE
MASCRIEWKASALRELKKIDRQVVGRIVRAVEGLADDPFPAGGRKLRGAEHTYRLRIGEYRVVYEVAEAGGVVVIFRVRHRRDAYRR